ncbi:MAG TPA: tetratricopeptide repeat protein [Tepidisphaeraceae bacterium]|jgi:tetratricopeptide (TPR) repeat protein|nr:tetratricopeptide repeat protein [Tepidisphaeraceae bacterium]
MLRQALADHQQGRAARAERGYRQVLASDPQNVDALHLLGLLIARRDTAAGIELVRQAVALRPSTAVFHNSLGTLLASRGDLDAAVAAFGQAIFLSPKYPAAQSNLGTVLQQMGRLVEAEQAQRQAIDSDPNYAQAYSHLGDTLRKQGQLEEAIAAHRRAISLDPQQAMAHNNLGVALREAGRPEDALSAFERAAEVQPDYPAAHYNLAMVLLLTGSYQRGWEEYRWRWRLPEFRSRVRQFSQHSWEGSQASAQTVLLHAEQGFGDTLQMVRFASLVAARGATVILECQPELKGLLSNMAGVRQVIERGESLPPFDSHASLMDLPRILRTRVDSIPRQVPYLMPDPAAASQWRSLLPAAPRPMLVGIAWSGNSYPDPQRLCPVEALRPLAELSEVQLISVQKRPATDEEQRALHLKIPAQPLSSFHDTAALIANLDLVISVDTAVAHLAGAMGRPVWTLLPFSADWRWLQGRNDSPWYPTMRLFRQSLRCDWPGLVGEVCAALKGELKSRSARGSGRP